MTEELILSDCINCGGRIQYFDFSKKWIHVSHTSMHCEKALSKSESEVKN